MRNVWFVICQNDRLFGIGRSAIVIVSVISIVRFSTGQRLLTVEFLT